MAQIRIRRGLEANRLNVTPEQGELIFTTDEKKLFIGDGTTAGGIPVQPYETELPVNPDELVVFSDDTGLKFKKISKATLLSNYYTSAQVDQLLSGMVNIKVNNALQADNASKLGERDALLYFTKDAITQSYTEEDEEKVSSAAATKAMYEDIQGKLNTLTTDVEAKANKSDISSSVTSSSTTSIANSNAVKTAYDLARVVKLTADTGKATADEALTKANEALQTANSAGSAPNLPAEQKRKILYGVDAPTGVDVEGTVFIQY